MIELFLVGPQDTVALGRRLARGLRAGDVVLLEGPLGAGKSALVRAMLRALTGEAGLEVPSPTFTLVQSYETPIGVVQHFDLWRLEGPAGVRDLGWEEAEVAFVEWPDRLGTLRPGDALVVALEYAGEGRLARLTGWEGRL